MNIFLWVLQALLALHTLTGALWKFANTEQSVPSLAALPHGVWMALSVFEIVCALCLVVPAFKRRLGILIPLGAAGIAAEMLLFTGLHIASGDPQTSNMIYWLVVAALCAFIAYGRTKLKPIQ